jgi:GT2 family glycosyltransferase
MRVSVVMAYYNRKQLLINTLKSIEGNTSYKDFEIIIVDDASSEEHRIEDVLTQFKMDIKLIRVDPETKTHINPCIPYNIGFKEAQGDIVVIQNPECFHLGDIISDVSNLKHNEYKVYHCYSLPESETNKLSSGSLELKMLNKGASFNGDHGWYCHGRFNPRPYHFCSAIHKKDLEDLGGFDERYANGKSYDDDEFATRIVRKGMDISFVSNPLVAHQWHYTSEESEVNSNKDLFFEKTLKESGWKVNTEL